MSRPLKTSGIQKGAPMLFNKKLPDGSIEFWQGSTLYNPLRQVDPSRFIEVHFSMTSTLEHIAAIEERISEEFLKFRTIAERKDVPFHFSDRRIGNFIIACSEAFQNSILHDPHDIERMVSISIWCDPEALILVGITDSLGPIAFEQWNLSVDNGEVYLGVNKRGLFIMTAYADRVLYFPDDKGPDKEMILILEPDQ